MSKDWAGKGPDHSKKGMERENPARTDWWRQDPKLQQAHGTWHVINANVGIPSDSALGGQLKDQQGELFFYFHRLLVARYDMERIALGMSRVRPWNDYHRDIDPWGYNPGPIFTPTFSPRLPGKKWENVPAGAALPFPATVDQMAVQRDRLFEAAQSGRFVIDQPPKLPQFIPVSANLLGATTEAGVGSVERVPFNGNSSQFSEDLYDSFYGNQHSLGHVFFAALSVDPDKPGVMSNNETSPRDPLFFRWHKQIDDIWFTWQEMLPPNDFADAPPVVIRQAIPGETTGPNQSPDIILVQVAQLPEWDDWQEFGELTFGGANWDKDFSDGPFKVNELHTFMRERVVTVEMGVGETPPHKVPYLNHAPFFYFIRMENKDNRDRDVTVRIFLTPEETAEDRRMWAEMDKFKVTLGPRQRKVVWRPDTLASILQKPVENPPGVVQLPVIPPQGPDPLPSNEQVAATLPVNFCHGGWPYNLLLPRGTTKGMGFRLLVMLTDYELDHVPGTSLESDCGSISIDGGTPQDGFVYPDRRPMGYPFDRPFPDSIAKTIARQHNMATRDFTIRRLKEDKD